MKKIGIIVCNYNKVDYLVKCIQSIFCSSFQDFDLIVVDNASTDDSMKEITELKKDIILIQNKKNLGGSGGFNVGLKSALKKEYEYIMLVDNDVVFDKEAIGLLYHFMEHHKEIGLTGAKILKMDLPSYLQELGAKIDFNELGVKPCFAGEKDEVSIPEIVYCDYVPACALIARTDAIKKIGIFSEENFIYWDDIEWGYRFNQKGYKVAAYSKAKVWHKGGVNISNNTFQTYYWYRNKIRFFLNNYCIDGKKDIKEKILEEIFRAIYSCFYSKRYNKAKTLMNAFLDAIYGIMGEAEDYKIRPLDVVEDRFTKLVSDKNKIILEVNGCWEILEKIISKIKQCNCNCECMIISSDNNSEKEKLKAKYPDIKLIEYSKRIDYDIWLKLCKHIFSLQESKFDTIYIDSWCNVVLNEIELRKCVGFQESLELFKICYYDIFKI